MKERRLYYEHDYFVFVGHLNLVSEYCATVYHLQKNQTVYVLHVTSKSYLRTILNDVNFVIKNSKLS